MSRRCTALLLAIALVCTPIGANPLVWLSGSPPAAGGSPPTTTATDAFNRANESLQTGPYAVASGGLQVSSNAVKTSSLSTICQGNHTTAVSSTSQWIRAVITPSAGSYSGLVLRYTNSSSAHYLFGMNETGDTVYWSHLASVGGAENDASGTSSGSYTINSATAYSVGITLTGTGSSTTMRVWMSTTASAPDSLTSWDSTSPTFTWTASGTYVADSGTLLGMWAYETSFGTSIDDLSFGYF